MGRFVGVAFFIMCFMFGLNLWNVMNECYWHGYTTATAFCPLDVGQGHPFINYEKAPIFGYDSFFDGQNNRINMSDVTSWNSTINDAVAYRAAPSGISDILGFITWVVTGMRLIANIFILPFYGFPEFLTNFLVPEFIATGIGIILGIVQVVGLYEFATGREIM